MNEGNYEGMEIDTFVRKYLRRYKVHTFVLSYFGKYGSTRTEVLSYESTKVPSKVLSYIVLP